MELSVIPTSQPSQVNPCLKCGNLRHEWAREGDRELERANGTSRQKIDCGRFIIRVKGVYNRAKIIPIKFGSFLRTFNFNIFYE